MEWDPWVTAGILNDILKVVDKAFGLVCFVRKENTVYLRTNKYLERLICKQW